MIKKITVIGGKAMEKELKKTTSRFDKFILEVGLTVGILGMALTFMLEREIYRPLRLLSIIIYLVYWYRDKNYKFKYFLGYVGSLIGIIFILLFTTAFAMRFLLGEAWSNFLFMIFILIFIGIVFPIIDSCLYQKFKIMSYTNEELKKKMTVSENI